MSSEVLVSRPYFDTRAVAQQSEQQPPPPDAETSIKEDLYAGTSAGLATAGYRTAKYTPAEWFSNNYATLRQAVDDHKNAERIMYESKTLSTETEAVALRTQAQGTRHLGERLQDIHFLKSELERHIEQLLAETDLLLVQKRRLERAIDATDIPFAIATDNLSCRERRFGPDLVTDEVEEELLKEVELIRSIQALLKKTLDQVVNQIRANRQAKETLEHDWSDKRQAYNLDDQCGRYNNRSTDTQHHHVTSTLQEQVCEREGWVSFTQANLALSEGQQGASVSLRQLVERALLETAGDLRAQGSTVEQTLSQRCLQLSQAKTQLELHLAQVLQQIGAQERNISGLQQALYDKDAPLRVAEARLHTRAHRPNMEQCRDVPQLSLLGEVGQINSSVARLQEQLGVARRSLTHLEETRMNLEKDICCKTNSLLIDQHKCLAHRTRYPTVTTLSGY